MAYVRLGKRGMGRVARAHRASVSRLGQWRNLGLLRLGQDESPDVPVNTDPTLPPILQQTEAIENITGYAPTQSQLQLFGSSSGISSGGGISPTDANLLSQAITTAGKVGTQAIIGTPTLTFNPATGAYTATGGATLPTSALSLSSLSAYLPLILLVGGGFLLISAMGKR